MNIRRLLLIVSCALVLAALLFGISIHSSQKQYRSAIQGADVANQIVLLVNERRLVGDDYLLHQGDRPKIQWYTKQGVIESLVTSEKKNFTTQKEQVLIEEIKTNLVGSRSIFTQLVAHNESTETPSSVSAAKTDLLASSLILRGQETILAASQLATINNTERTNALARVINLFSTTAGLFFLTVLVSFIALWRNGTRLDQEKVRQEAILASMGDGLIVTDEHGTILLINPGAEKLLGWSAKDVLGKRKQEVLTILDEHGQKVPAENRPIQRAFTSGEVTSSKKYSYVRKDGSSFPTQITVAPFRLAGKIIGVVDVFSDNTEGDKIDKMKSDFISLVSHQLKTPVGVIRGYIENMLLGLTGEFNPRQKEYLERMRLVSIRNFELISDLLNVSRIERGVIAVELQPVKIGEVIETAMSDYVQAAADKKIALKAEMADPNMVILADKAKLTECVRNTINNAMKYTEKGTITLKSRSDESFAYIDVVDTGKGISTEGMKKLFTRDKVLSGSPSPDGSSGLGLFIAKNFMQLQHGDITASSEPGQGSTFTFTIPLA